MDRRFSSEHVWKLLPPLYITVKLTFRSEMSGVGLYTGLAYCLGFGLACVETDM